MKNEMKIYNIGQLLLVLGSALYVVDLVAYESWTFTLAICGASAVALILMLIGWCGTREERAARKAAARAAKASGKAA